MTVQLLQGDCLEMLKTLPDGIVQTCVTSPPYYGLRDYGTAKWEGGDSKCDHSQARKNGRDTSTLSGGQSGNCHEQEPFKHICSKCGAVRVDNQIGLEETPEAYVAKLVAVFREVKRVLKDDGTLWLNLGDSYAGSGKGQGGKGTTSAKQLTNWGSYHGNIKIDYGDCKPKDLIGIPWMVAFALRADGWYLRSEIIWAKPNPMPESVTDRPTKSHEQIFLLAKSPKYFYDAEAIKEKSTQNPADWNTNGTPKRESYVRGEFNGKNTLPGKEAFRAIVPSRNKRSVWTVTTKPYREAHFATFPPDLIEPCILAGTSEKGECRNCGKAWVRVTERIGLPRNNNRTHSTEDQRNGKMPAPEPVPGGNTSPIVKTIDWQPQCDCDFSVVPQIVLDPFSGSGTTGEVAILHNRDYIGIELNPDYIDLTKKRLAKVQPILV